MGQTISNSVVYDSVNKTTNDFLTKNTNKTELDAKVYQSVVVKDATFVCTGGLTNESDVTIKTVQSLTAQTTDNLISNIVSDLKDTIGNKSTAVSGWLSTPDGQSQTSNIMTHARNIIKNRNVVENAVSTSQHVSVEQTMTITDAKFDPCGFSLGGTIPAGGCNLPCPIMNDVNIFLVAQQVAKDTTDILVNDSFLQQQLTDITNSADSKSTGPIQEFGQAIADFFKALSTPLLIIGVVIIIGLIVSAIIALSKGGQKAMSSAANVASKGAMMAV